jgi:hypothetical protein
MQYIEGQTLAKVIADLRLQMAVLQKKSGKVETPGEPGTHDYRPAPCDHQPAIGDGQSGNPTAAPVAALSTQRSTKSPAFFRTVANLGVQAAEALEHAHQLGIVHRDVKPGNLLIETSSPLAPPGSEGLRLWITDLGLAHCQSQVGLTMTGDLVGTLRYMSPEQALGKRVAVDRRTDIYSLGVTLYELLTLEPAFAGHDRQELLRQIAFEEPRSPRRLDRHIPRGLETIVLKAMAKEPEKRYPSAEALAEDLKRFLADEPIRARRAPLWERVLRWVKRRPALAALLGTVALALAGLLAGGIKYNVDLQAAVEETTRERNAARNAEGQVRGERDAARKAERKALAEGAAARKAEAQARDQRDAARRALEQSRRNLYALQLALAAAVWEREPGYRRLPQSRKTA